MITFLQILISVISELIISVFLLKKTLKEWAIEEILTFIISSLINEFVNSWCQIIYEPEFWWLYLFILTTLIFIYFVCIILTSVPKLRKHLKVFDRIKRFAEIIIKVFIEHKLPIDSIIIDWVFISIEILCTVFKN